MGMKADTPEGYAKQYRALLQAVADSCDPTAAEELPAADPELSEMEVQSLWAVGMFGNEWESERHGHVSILDFGEWNRSAGPDFLFAEIKMNGRLVRGDIEIDPNAQAWEQHGHGANPRFNNVVLHVVLTKPPQGWYTRNSMHMEVPVVYLSAQRVREALEIQQPAIDAICGRNDWNGRTELCAKPLEGMNPAQIETLLMSAAAHRIECKRRRYRRKVAVLGEAQASYEAWAECLGYSANKEPMIMLARRAPLHRLRGVDAEAVLLGMAGFLKPVLPSRAEPEARAYHRRVWDAWWKVKDDFALEGQRSPTWQFTGIRPFNHPHRRVAALAVSATHWQEMMPLLTAAHSRQLMSALCELHHPFWERHSMLDSPVLQRTCALVGRERAKDFLCNHVYVRDETREAWTAFTRLTRTKLPTRVAHLARALFGQREDLRGIMRHEYACQALLQIGTDFCRNGACQDCLFPLQLKSLCNPR